MFHETPDLTMGQFETLKTTIKHSFKVSNELRQVMLTSTQKLKTDLNQRLYESLVH